MLRNELIHKEMVECSQTSKSQEQKHTNKDYLKHSIYCAPTLVEGDYSNGFVRPSVRRHNLVSAVFKRF